MCHQLFSHVRKMNIYLSFIDLWWKLGEQIYLLPENDKNTYISTYIFLNPYLDCSLEQDILIICKGIFPFFLYPRCIRKFKKHFYLITKWLKNVFLTYLISTGKTFSIFDEENIFLENSATMGCCSVTVEYKKTMHLSYLWSWTCSSLSL